MWRSPAEEKVYRAIQRNDPASVAAICKEAPDVVTSHLPGEKPQGWVACALRLNGKMPLITALLDAGFDVNAVRLPEGSTALCAAVGRDDAEDVVSLLLSRGANPNLGRAVVGVLNRTDSQNSSRILQLLFDYGLNANNLFDFAGDKNKLFTALDWAKDPMHADLIRRHGGKYAVELVGERAAFAERRKGDESECHSDNRPSGPAVPPGEV